MSVKVSYLSQVTVTETIEENAGSLSSTGNSVKHTGLNTSKDLTATSEDVPVAEVAAFEKTLSGGAGSIDLTALAGTNGNEVDGTGLKVQAIKFIADAGNEAAVTVKEGVSDGYELLGASWTLDLAAGQEILLFGNEAAPDIGVAAKAIDLASTHLTAKVNCLVVMG